MSRYFLLKIEIYFVRKSFDTRSISGPRRLLGAPTHSLHSLAPLALPEVLSWCFSRHHRPPEASSAKPGKPAVLRCLGWDENQPFRERPKKGLQKFFGGGQCQLNPPTFLYTIPRGKILKTLGSCFFQIGSKQIKTGLVNPKRLSRKHILKRLQPIPSVSARTI